MRHSKPVRLGNRPYQGRKYLLYFYEFNIVSVFLLMGGRSASYPIGDEHFPDRQQEYPEHQIPPHSLIFFNLAVIPCDCFHCDNLCGGGFFTAG